MSLKSISKVWSFKSSSSDKTYQTLLYSDSSTSCDCPGWTRRVDTQGNRSCRHTRSVDMGSADSEAIDCHGYAKTSGMLHTGEVVSVKKSKSKNLSQPVLTYGRRKLCI